MGNSLSSSKRVLEKFRSNDGGNEENLCDRCSGVTGSGECTGRAKGKCCCTPKGLPSPSCVYYSPRILGLLRGETTELETAMTHWTAVDPESEAELESVAEENRSYFDEVLVKHPEWGHFFSEFEDLKVGDKIGEGGQAEIFAATSQSFTDACEMVAKVWKAGVSLKGLERQWPPEMLSKIAGGGAMFPFRNLYGGAFIRDGEFKNRFAFVMRRFECDLRAYMDHRMLMLALKKSHGAPFNDIHAVIEVLWSAIVDLNNMHKAGVVHRDIKASNVLVDCRLEESFSGNFSFMIDYECSVGVIGTGFWRAPEILEQVIRRTPSSEVVFTKKADIYSFGMMCYEVITGCIPFEGHEPQNDYNIVVNGGRPVLPHDLHLELREIILDCWQHEPQLRPT